MHYNQDRILTTHVGSLPRPASVESLLVKMEHGEGYDEAAMEQEISTAVAQSVMEQRDWGIDIVNDGEKPLALYIFSSDKQVQQKILDSTSSGGATVNHTWMHLAVIGLPFGGVGSSGMGAYHGKASFETFSHRKSVLFKSTTLDPGFVYPPYDESKKKWIKRLV